MACHVNGVQPADATRDNQPTTGDAKEAHALTCSVVVCTRNRPAWLERCLEAASRLDYPSVELVVVDNAPQDGRAQEIAKHYGARYLREPRPGLSRARNLGAHACQTDVVAFVDDDAIPEPTCLSHLVAEFADPQVMAVAGGTVPLAVETEAERLCASMNGFGTSRPRVVVDRRTPYWFAMANFGGIGNGGNMAFRRQAFDIWRGFDERFGRGTPLFGGDEHHAFFSLIDRGYRVVYAPAAMVRHPFPRTLEQLRTRHFKSLSATTGYFALLFIEQPRYRRATLEYIWEALKGTPRAWQHNAQRPRPQIIPSWQAAIALLAGPILYLWTCATRRAHRR